MIKRSPANIYLIITLISVIFYYSAKMSDNAIATIIAFVLLCIS